MNTHALTPGSLPERFEKTAAIEKKTAFIQPVNKRRPVEQISGMRGVLIAAGLLVLGTGAYIYMMHNISRNLKAGLTMSTPGTEELEQKKGPFNEKIHKGNITSGIKNDENPKIPNSSIVNIYRDSPLSKILVLIKDLPTLPPGQQYQLWAVTGGVHQGLMVFEAGKDDILIFDMTRVNQADSFAVTIINTNNPIEPASGTIAPKKAF